LRCTPKCGGSLRERELRVIGAREPSHEGMNGDLRLLAERDAILTVGEFFFTPGLSREDS
jgi:hypothetical protein